ncbi:MAG: Uma2 family endonuclease [Saprospiraceae bacterium]|nr:Uma2 family endonuclease [Lewinella sp.]
MSQAVIKSVAPLVKKYRFTVDEYHQMGTAGIFQHGERVELIQGEIFEMSPINSPHAGTIKLLNRMFTALLGNQFIIGIQDPIQLDKYSEPEPDLCVLTFREDMYIKSHPQSHETLLVVEVADSSLAKDREVKAPLYAAAGIPEMWIINLSEQQIEVYTQPAQEGYSQIHIYRKNEVIKTGLIKGLNVNEVFLIQ